MKVKNEIGKKYYKYNENGEVELYRVVNIKDNDNIFIIRNEKTFEKLRIKRETLFDKFTLLRPIGAITFASVTVEHGMKDVIVSLMKETNGKYDTYAVCRQNAYDFFSNSLRKETDIVTYVGVSLSKDTCPAKVDFRTMSACKSVEYGEIVYIYLDDTLNSIIRLIKRRVYDDTLKELASSIEQNPETPIFGYCTSLRELLEDNKFMDDFYRAYNIIKTKFTIGKDCIFTSDYVKQLEEILKCRLSDIVLVKYWYDIDFSKFKKEYSIISDASNNLYVVSYESNGYKNDTYAAFNDHNETDYLEKFITK